MSRFPEFCYLAVQRNKANSKRHRLLYYLNKKLKNLDLKYKYHVQQYHAVEERDAYRKQADAMKKIAKEVYSPLRRELKIKCMYSANNKLIYLKYQGEYFDLNKVEEIANTYLFENIVLREDVPVNTAYENIL